MIFLFIKHFPKSVICYLFHRCPYPPLGEFRQVLGIDAPRFGIFDLAGVFAFGALFGLPSGAALGEDALEQLGRALVGAGLLAGEFGFGGDQAALAGGFEEAGFVAFEVGLDALEGGDARVEIG